MNANEKKEAIMKAVVGAMDGAVDRYHGEIGDADCHLFADRAIVSFKAKGKKPRTLARWLERELTSRIDDAYDSGREVLAMVGEEGAYMVVVSICFPPFAEGDAEA